MTRGKKITAITLLSFFVLLMAAAFVLPYIISLDRYKGVIETKLGEALQRKVSVGRLRITIVPSVGVKIEDLVISNPPGFSPTPFLSLQVLKVRVKILPLIFGKKEIAKLILQRPEILIERDTTGRLNIPLMDAKPVPERRGTLKSGKIDVEGSRALQGFLLSTLSIKGTKIIYQDQRVIPAQRTEIGEIDLLVKDLCLEKRIYYDLSLREAGGEISVKGWLGPLGKTIDLMRIPIEGSLKIDIPQLGDFLKKVAGAGDPSLHGALAGELNFSGDTGSALTGRGEIAMNSLSLGEKDEQMIQDLDLILRPEVVLSFKEEKVRLRSFLKIEDTPFDITGEFKDLRTKPSGRLTISSQERIQVGKWGKTFPAINKVANVKGDLAVTGYYILSPQSTSLFSLEADSSRMDITLVSNKKVKGARETPQQRRTEAPQGTQPIKKGGPSITGKFTVKEGTFEKVSFHNLQIIGAMKGGNVEIESFSLGAFGGSLNGSGRFGGGPFQITTRVTDVNVDNVLSGLTSWKGMMKGQFNGDLTLRGKEFSMSSLKENLTGNGAVRIRDGELSWLNLVGSIIQALGAKGWDTKKTTFEDLSTSFSIQQGQVSFPDLVLTYKDMAMKLQGVIGLDLKLHMNGEAHLPASVAKDLSGKAWGYLKDEKGRLTIPFTLKGDLRDPKVGIGTTDLIERGLEGVFEKLIRKKRH